MPIKYVYVLDDKVVPEAVDHIAGMQSKAAVISRSEFTDRVVPTSLYELEERLGIVGRTANHVYCKSKFLGRPCLYFENNGYHYVFLNNARRNQKRAAEALGCIEVYSGYDSEDLESSVVDVLDDIMHLCVERDIDFNACALSAESHFDAEVLPDEIEAGSMMVEVGKEL